MQTRNKNQCASRWTRINPNKQVLESNTRARPSPFRSEKKTLMKWTEKDSITLIIKASLQGAQYIEDIDYRTLSYTWHGYLLRKELCDMIYHISPDYKIRRLKKLLRKLR